MKAKMKCAKNDFRLWNDKERALSKFTAIWIVSTLTMKLGLKQSEKFPGTTQWLLFSSYFKNMPPSEEAAILCISSLCLSINFYSSSLLILMLVFFPFSLYPIFIS